MALNYSLNEEAYVKLMLHSAKFPHRSVNGLLIGSETEMHISDAIPLFHQHLNLAASLEAACLMVEAALVSKQEEKKKIIGYYHVSAAHEEEFREVFQRIADKIELNCSRACVLWVKTQELNSESNHALQLRLKDVKRGWVPVEDRFTLRNENEAKKMLSQALVKRAQFEVVDFDEHFEDVSKDWRNLNLFKLLQLDA